MAVPKILIVILLPENPQEWVNHSEAELCLRKCGYWLSLKGKPQTRNVESVTVYLPRQQIFTVNAVKNLMEQVEARDQL